MPPVGVSVQSGAYINNYNSSLTTINSDIATIKSKLKIAQSSAQAKVTLLPEPEGPMMAIFSPSLIVLLIPFNTTLLTV